MWHAIRTSGHGTRVPPMEVDATAAEGSTSGPSRPAPVHEGWLSSFCTICTIGAAAGSGLFSTNVQDVPSRPAARTAAGLDLAREHPSPPSAPPVPGVAHQAAASACRPIVPCRVGIGSSGAPRLLECWSWPAHGDDVATRPVSRIGAISIAASSAGRPVAALRSDADRRKTKARPAPVRASLASPQMAFRLIA